MTGWPKKTVEVGENLSSHKDKKSCHKDSFSCPYARNVLKHKRERPMATSLLFPASKIRLFGILQKDKQGCLRLAHRPSAARVLRLWQPSS